MASNDKGCCGCCPCCICCCCQAIWDLFLYILCCYCCRNKDNEKGMENGFEGNCLNDENENEDENFKKRNDIENPIIRKNSNGEDSGDSLVQRKGLQTGHSPPQSNEYEAEFDNKYKEDQQEKERERKTKEQNRKIEAKRRKEAEEKKDKERLAEFARIAEEKQKQQEEKKKIASQNTEMAFLLQEISKIAPEHNLAPEITTFHSSTDPNHREAILSEISSTLDSYLIQQQDHITLYSTLISHYTSLSSNPPPSTADFSTKTLKEMDQEIAALQGDLDHLEKILIEKQQELAVLSRDVREMKGLVENEESEEERKGQSETVEEIGRKIEQKYVELEKEVERVILTRPTSIEEIIDRLEILTLKDPQSHPPLLPLSSTIATLKAHIDTLTESALKVMEEDSKSEVANQILYLTEGPFCSTVLKNFDPACEDWVIKVEGQHSLRQHRVLHDHLEQVPEAVIKLLEVTGLKEKSNLNQSNEDEKDIDSKEESKEETKEDIDEDKEEVKEENKEEAKEGSKEDMKHVESSGYKSIKPFEITFENFDFSNNYECLIELLKTSIQTQLLKLVFVECSLPEILEESVKHLEFITPDNKMRPLYGISFDACTFPNPPELKDPSILEKDPKNIDKADQIGLLLNIEGLPSAKYLGEPPSEINGGISSIALKNNGFTEVEMAKLKVYLCYAEHLIIYEEE
ncbi:unnamed protein product [Moneuplotes crassus]|uniref:Uncharacterized protein n=1 Tax=Euplotes crassus TaxID=5936 RepID=A0AAD2D223_EUPCR|nr:unnamed protein product [Moneuplotes crassus]